MENYIMINGAKLELTPEQVAALTAETEKDDPFSLKEGELYYWIGDRGQVLTGYTWGDAVEERLCDAANYCRDETKTKQRALHEILDRLLWRYSEQHGGDPEWDGRNAHWSVYRDTEDGEWRSTDLRKNKNSGPHFCSQAIAEAAIHDVVEPFCEAHPEFVW